MKTVYLYDANGILEGSWNCQPDARNPGAYIEPESSTEKVPPTLTENQCAVFSQNAWTVQPDYRGQTWFDANGNPVVIEAIGTTSGLTESLPAAIALANAQAAQIQILQDSYNAAIQAPVNYTTAAGKAATFATDPTSIANMQKCLDAFAKSGVFPLNLWLDVNSAVVTPFTYADLQGLAAAIGAAEIPDYTFLLGKLALVDAATDIPTVQAVVW